MQRRRSGVLLHPSSLPGEYAIGDLGSEAFHFVDFLHASHQKIWQTLPLGPTHADMSPYQSLSSNAGNPALIDLRPLIQKGLIKKSDTEMHTYEDVLTMKRRCIGEAWNKISQETSEYQQHFSTFCKKHQDWLHDFALYTVIKNKHKHTCWVDWPIPLRDRNEKALKDFYQQNQADVDTIKFEQYLFFSQWHTLKQYANEKGISIFGDLPIFVAHDSSEVWVSRQYFQLDEKGQPNNVAGVPPDYFSETGQRWGNPLYAWETLEKDDFSWWKIRLENQLELFDLVRIDHFRGFEAYWSIAAEEETAINGHWIQAPGKKLFQSLQKHFKVELPLVAEDLGVITAEVEALRDEFNLPGMKILQFAFDGSNDNPYLPHQHSQNSVVYTGTHDNDTTVGWFNTLNDEQRSYVYDYLFNSTEEINWLMIKVAMASVANLCIIPLQDILGLDSSHRMNTPGTAENNWRWRYKKEWLKDEYSEKLRQLTHRYQR